MIRLCRNQLVRLHAHHHIGGFDADDQIVIPHILDQIYFIEGTLDNPLRRHTVIFFHQILFQGTAVYPTRIGTLLSFAASTTALIRSLLPMFPGLILILSAPFSIAAIAMR